MKIVVNFLRYSLLAVFVSITAGSAFGQTEKSIAAIRHEVASINKNASKYDKKTLSVEGLSLEGSQATYFISGRGLKKITAKIYGETYRSTAELFYQGEDLIFAYRKLERYNTHIAADPPPKVSKVVETRVYFADSAAIRVLEGQRKLKKDDVFFNEAEMEIVELSDALKAAWEKKDPSPDQK